MTKNKIKTPLPLRIIGWAYPKLERIAPWLAKRWFVKIFFSPARYKMPYGELELSERATKYRVNYEGKQVQVYEWGEGKPVLMVHGWMGRATQFRKFVPDFNKAGFKVVAFDATGHGKSQGNISHLMEFAGIITLMGKRYGQFEMIVGHSLGGVAAMHAIIGGVNTNKLVMISSPTIGHEIVDVFKRKLNASNATVAYFNQYIVKKFGLPFEHYSAGYNVAKLPNTQLFLVYDENDPEVTLAHAQVLMNKYKSAELYQTKGLGHTRILKDAGVIAHVLGKLVIKEKVSPYTVLL